MDFLCLAEEHGVDLVPCGDFVLDVVVGVVVCHGGSLVVVLAGGLLSFAVLCLCLFFWCGGYCWGGCVFVFVCWVCLLLFLFYSELMRLETYIGCCNIVQMLWCITSLKK